MIQLYDTLYESLKKNDLKKAEDILGDKTFDFEEAENLYAGGQTLLNYACQQNCTEIAIKLLESGAATIINRPAEKENITNALWACRNSNLPLLMELLKHGETDINEQDKTHGETALSWACDRNNIPMIEALLRHGGEKSLNKRKHAEPKQTPLYNELVSATNLKKVKLLVENGALIDEKLITTNYQVSMSEEIKTYLKDVFKLDKDVFELDKEENKLQYIDYKKLSPKQAFDLLWEMKEKLLDTVITKIERNGNKEIPEKLQNIIRLFFCRSTLVYLKQSHVFYGENLFFRLVQEAHENPQIKEALCATFEIEDESLLKPENFPELLEFIVNKIELCAAQTKEVQETLGTVKRIFGYHKKDDTERKIFVDENMDYTAKDNEFSINFIDQTKIHLSKILLNR